MSYPEFQNNAALLLVRPLLIVMIGCIAMIGWGIALRLRTMRRTQHWANLDALWTPRLLAVLSGDAPPEAMHDLVLPANRFHFITFLTRYVRRFAGEERLVLYHLAAPYLAEVARRAKRGSAERRAFALQTLSMLGLSGYSDVVLDALDDESELVAMVAAQELARSGNAAYAAPILARLRRFDHWSGRYLAALLTGMGRDAMPALRAKLADTQERPRVRAIAATALHLLRDASAVQLAAELAEHERDRDFMGAALALIADLGGPEHLAVVRRLSWANDFVIRAQAVETLGRIGEAEDIDRVRLALQDESPWVALRAATALRRMGALDVLRELAALETPRSAVAREALQASA